MTTQGLQPASDTDLMRRLEREVAELKQQFREMRGEPAAQATAAQGGTINLQVLSQSCTI